MAPSSDDESMDDASAENNNAGDDVDNDNPLLQRKFTLLWSHFEPSSKPGKVKCCVQVSYVLGMRKCGAELVKTTTAARKHLRTKHSATAKRLEEQEASGGQPIAKNMKEDKSQLTLQEYQALKEKYGPQSERKKQIDEALALALSIPCMSVNIFTHPLVRQLFHALDPKYDPSSFHGLKALLAKPYERIVASLKASLTHLRFKPSVIADIWTDG